MYEAVKLTQQEVDKLLEDKDWMFAGEDTNGQVYWNRVTGELLSVGFPSTLQRIKIQV